jgi:hypothetical protein
MLRPLKLIVLAAAENAAEPDDHERLLVESAAVMVASGASTRVVLAGLRRGELILPFAQERARELGIVARGIWHEGGCDIAIEPYA